MKIMRHSGLPVVVENLELYKKDWTAQFDILKEKHGNDMLSLQKDLAELDTQLCEKYSVVEDQQVPKTHLRVFKALMQKYECPIMLAPSALDQNEIVIVIMDKPLL